MDRLDKNIKTVFSKIKQAKSVSSDCPSEETLAAYAEARLSPEKAEPVEMHMASCSMCLDAVLSLSGNEEMETDSAVSNETLQKIKGFIISEDKPPFWTRISGWFSGMSPKPAWAVASVFLVVLAYVLYSHQIGDNVSGSASPIGSIMLIAGIPSDQVTRGKEIEYKGVELKNGAALRSGDRFRIAFSLEKDGYAYVILSGSTGNPDLLYPKELDDDTAQIQSHKTITLPGSDQWFRLDTNEGEETVYLITSTNAIEDIHLKLSHLRDSQHRPIAEIFPDTNIQRFSIEHQ